MDDRSDVMCWMWRGRVAIHSLLASCSAFWRKKLGSGPASAVKDASSQSEGKSLAWFMAGLPLSVLLQKGVWMA